MFTFARWCLSFQYQYRDPKVVASDASALTVIVDLSITVTLFGLLPCISVGIKKAVFGHFPDEVDASQAVSDSPVRHGKLTKRPCATNIERIPSTSAINENYGPSELLLSGVCQYVC